MPEWFDPLQVKFKISPHGDLGSVESGDWDLTRRYPLEEATKYRSIIQRYSEGLAWEETDLFQSLYARRIESEPIRGEATMKGLLEQYYTRVDGMFDDLKRNGFREGYPLPRILIGRGREIFIGNQGNHRLAMAHVLKLDKIAGEVICKHRLTT